MTDGAIGEAKEADYIAPRGLSSKATKDWILMDGMYHTWLVMRDNTFPPIVQTGWLDNIPIDYGIDVDIIAKRLNRSTVETGLKQMRKYKYSSFNANRTNFDKAESISKEIQNAEYIKQCMSNYDEDLFSCEVIITVRAETYALMRELKNSIQKHLEGLSIYTSTSFLAAHEWLKNTAPDMYVTKSFFKKYSHNMLTRNMAQLYPFTSMSLFDNEGYVVGRNVQGSSLVSFNNFNTQLYSNGNIVIMGTPGSGKSFLEMMLASRMRMMGVRTMFILPLKAHEYYNACEKMGVEFYSNGQDINDPDYDKKSLRAKVGLVFQYPEHQLFETDCFKDVCFGPKNLGLSQKEVELRAYEALKQVGFDDDYFYQSPFDLSGGQKRRVAIAGVLAMKPEVLILDEPTAGLDPKGREDILNLISRLHQEMGITIILVSHSMDDVANYVQRIIVMNKGRVAFDDEPKEVFRH